MANRITLTGFCLIAVLVVVCASCKPEQIGTETLASTPTPDQRQEKVSEDSTLKPHVQPKSERSPKAMDIESINKWSRLLRTSGLTDLEYTNLPPDDVEIRVWQVPGLYTSRTKCWIFSLKSGVWTGSAIVDREFTGQSIRVWLDRLPTGSTKWNDYVHQKLLPQSISEAAKTITPDVGREGEMTVLEVKFGKKYGRQFMANDEFLALLYKNIKSEFFNNDDSKWATF